MARRTESQLGPLWVLCLRSLCFIDVGFWQNCWAHFVETQSAFGGQKSWSQRPHLKSLELRQGPEMLGTWCVATSLTDTRIIQNDLEDQTWTSGFSEQTVRKEEHGRTYAISSDLASFKTVSNSNSTGCVGEDG